MIYHPTRYNFEGTALYPVHLLYQICGILGVQLQLFSVTKHIEGIILLRLKCLKVIPSLSHDPEALAEQRSQDLTSLCFCYYTKTQTNCTLISSHLGYLCFQLEIKSICKKKLLFLQCLWLDRGSSNITFINWLVWYQSLSTS